VPFAVGKVDDQTNKHPSKSRDLRTVIEGNDHSSANNDTQYRDDRHEWRAEWPLQMRLGTTHDPNPDADQTEGK
jgi:hypothetical protein